MRKLLFSIARSPFAGAFIGFAFAHLTTFMPLKRLFEDADCILFLHPVAYWEQHWLGVPKARIGRFVDCQSASEWRQLLATLRALQKTTAAQGVSDFTILVNGGAYQDVPQVHFHMARGATRDGVPWAADHYLAYQEGEIVENGGACAWPYADRSRSFHWQISAETAPSFGEINFENSAEINALTDLLHLTQTVISQHEPDAWTLQFHLDSNTPDPCLTAHLLT